MTTHNPSQTNTPTTTDRAARLGLTIPAPLSATGDYQQFTIVDDLVFIAGQIAIRDGELLATGLVGRDVDVELAGECARVCLLNVLAQLGVAAGGLDNVQSVVKLTVYVASAPSFTSQHVVANAASRLLSEVTGTTGKHSRSAVGVAALPLGSPVEIEAIARIGRAQ